MPLFHSNPLPALSKYLYIYTHRHVHTHMCKYMHKHTGFLNQMNFKVKATWKHSSTTWNLSSYQYLNHLEKCPKMFVDELFIFPLQWKISYPFLCWSIDLPQSSLASLESPSGIYGCSLRDIYPFPLDFLWDRKKNLRWYPCKPLSYRCLQTLLSQTGSWVQGKGW